MSRLYGYMCCLLTLSTHTAHSPEGIVHTPLNGTLTIAPALALVTTVVALAASTTWMSIVHCSCSLTRTARRPTAVEGVGGVGAHTFDL
jgi:hypothetical protein